MTSLEALAVDPSDAHHLTRVLRLRDGEAVTATDGAGGWRACRWRGGALEPDGRVHHVARARPALTIGFAPVKGDRPEWTAQKLTELGVDRIVPLHTVRSVVRWDGERGAAAVARLRRVTREALMQSRRCWLPEVTDVRAPSALPDAALAEPGAAPLSLSHPAVLVGPEGGWAPEELATAAATVSLGAGILRAETAALAAAVLLGALREGFMNTF